MRIGQSLLLSALALFGLATALPAQAVVCLAETQCRGDAERMCAPSPLRIKVKERSGRDHLWIGGEGPYSAVESREGDMRRWTIKAFGARYRLDIAPNGHFLYLGNRGKRFTGMCKEVG